MIRSVVHRLHFTHGPVCVAVLVSAAMFATSDPARGDAARPTTSVSLSPAPAPAPAPSPSAVVLVAPIGTQVAWRSGGAPRLLWTGFRSGTDGGQVFIQTSAEVELETKTGSAADPDPGPDGGSLRFVLKHCRAGRPTDRLALDTRFFRSPVTRVSVKRRAGNLEIAVSVREPVAAKVRKEAGPGGSWFWVFEFPPSAAASPPMPAVRQAALLF